MATLLPGLVSVTFRRMSPRQVVDLAVECGMAGVEWGGDVHVPDAASAREVRRMCEDAGVACVSYGSYYRAGYAADADVPDAEFVLDVAEALGVSCVRVWAGRVDARQADDAEFAKVADDLRGVVEAASAKSIRVAAEWHENTLTATPEAAVRLLDAVPGLLVHWQPSNGRTSAERSAELDLASPRLAHAHVFHWTETPDGRRRLPLADAGETWPDFLRRLADAPAQECVDPRYALLEFVRGDSPEQFRDDAETLRRWLSPGG